MKVEIMHNARRYGAYLDTWSGVVKFVCDGKASGSAVWSPRHGLYHVVGVSPPVMRKLEAAFRAEEAK